MIITRRTALGLIAAVSAANASRVDDSGSYKPEWSSLQRHACPAWYRDAKFGIYFHWGLYSVQALSIMRIPPSARFCQLWRDKVLEVVDRYHPDIVYFDTRSFIIEADRLAVVAHYYNGAHQLGREVTITFKEHDFAEGSGLADIEAGQLASKASFEWQTDDVLDWNSWAYLEKPNYKPAGRIIHQLIDVVSKNGNLLLDVGPRADGTIPDAIVSRLNTIGPWLRVNGEAIYETRPWEVFGEGPTKVKEGNYVADHNVDFGAKDIRFTTRGRNLYIHVLGDPGGRVVVTSIRRDTPLPFGPLLRAQMLGGEGALAWEWSPDGLAVDLPAEKPSTDAIVIRLS